ncbi:OmpA family protein [Tenacibaculum retecalamus]|uniref:OmpA family protein n=1 Tax=Tenacibaculum retecalamus TaxID=3018315 RepID=UPI0023D90DBC|nr:OmpA family protein [Tenacibaculum retecalamus]WBX71843.1 OmpA family protein [Tenacibaculum retecalamus]
MKKRIHIIAAIAVLSFNVSFAQTGKIKKADKAYNKFSYISTTKTLLQLVENGTANVNQHQQLANAYYFTGDMESAAKTYKTLMASEEKEAIETESYFRYVQSLKATENYTEADKWMREFCELEPNDSRAKAFKAQPDYLTQIEKLSDTFKLENLSINSENSDFGTALNDSKLIFASSRKEGKTYNWNAQPFLDLYTLNSDNEVTELRSDVNTKYHESSSVITKDGNTLYFTRNNYFKGKFKKNKDDAHTLKIYKATKVKGEWTNIEALPFNSNDYNVGHPALNKNGTVLYFSSDMPGGLGASDIYKVNIAGDGSFGSVKNLGKGINTEGRENFPFISQKGTLYFSSNGHLGLGGLDIFKVDDIYSFTKNPCEQLVSGVVTDATTKAIISNATVLVYDAAQQIIATLVSDTQGAFSFKLKCKEQTYKVVGSKLDFDPTEISFAVDNVFNEPVQLEIALTPIPKAAEVGADLFKLLDLKPILFDYDKSNIRPDAQIELEKVIAYMKEFPKVKIDIRSHTDSRGRDAYNLALSARRNSSTVTYIITKGGISKDRIKGKGYGETMLTNKCANRVKCSKEEHQANRRSEFIVTEN